MKSEAINGAANLLAVSRVKRDAKDKTPEVDFSAVMNQASFQSQEALQSDIAKKPEKSFNPEKTGAKDESRTEDVEKTVDKATETPKEEPASTSDDCAADVREEGNEAQNVPEEMVSKVSEFVSKVSEFVSKVSEFVSKVQKVLQDSFSVTDEELLSVLEQLGFTMADFVKPDVVNACIQALSGAQDSVALLVNEQLYEVCTQAQREIMALGQVLDEEVQLTEEEMKFIFSKLEELQTQSQPEGIQNVLSGEEVSAAALTEETESGEAVGMEKAMTTATEKDSTAVSFITQDKAEPKVRNLKEVEEAPEEEVTVKQTVEKLRGNSQESGMAEQNQLGNENQPELQPREPMTQNVFGGDTVFTSYTSYDGSYESIIRQVAEQVRVQVTADTSSMEMQLNPESLGKLTLSVELKQGMLTAKFVVENEQVKEVIENQTVLLREDLSRQGLKVEAIEVAVETHEFERNLEQGQQQSQAQEEARDAEKQKSGRRNLNLDILEEEETLTEAEDLASKIMKENGNTMDYFA